jgi:serine/threonine protein kinase
MTKYNLALRAVLSRRRAGEDGKPAKPFSSRQVASLMVQVTSGLEFLHRNKVMHRDVKPDNILCLLNSVGDIDLLAITDFDSAKLLTRSTSAKTTVGTPAYMAPEVMSSSNKDPYSFKADVWSVGMVLFELMTLKMPYEDEDSSRLVGMIAEGRRPSVDKIPASFAELISVFKVCTMLNPEERPEMSDVRERLQQIEWSLEQGSD